MTYASLPPRNAPKSPPIRNLRRGVRRPKLASTDSGENPDTRHGAARHPDRPSISMASRAVSRARASKTVTPAQAHLKVTCTPGRASGPQKDSGSPRQARRKACAQAHVAVNIRRLGEGAFPYEIRPETCRSSEDSTDCAPRSRRGRTLGLTRRRVGADPRSAAT